MMFRLGSKLAAELTPEEQYEIDQWHNGRELEHLTQQPGWEIVRNMIKAYADSATKELFKLLPGDPAVPQAHAAAKMADDIRHFFDSDVQNAINAGHTVPEVLRRAHANTSGLPPEAL
jgi:hypothetical protein